MTQAAQAAAILGDVVWKRFPWQSCGGAHEFTLPTTKDPVELILNRTWRSASRSPAPTDCLRPRARVTCCAPTRR